MSDGSPLASVLQLHQLFIKQKYHAGPVNPARHYCLDPLRRLDPDAVLSLIEQQKYFMLHALRQTGKTTCLLALREYLNTGNHSGSGKVRGIW